MLTRSGTNTLRGRLGAFTRSNTLDARQFFAKGEAPFSQNWYSGSVGGPIIRDRMHYFFAFEDIRQKQTAVVTSPLMPGEYEQPSREDKGQAKLDVQLGSAHHLTVRYNLDPTKTLNSGVGDLNTIERGVTSKRMRHDAQGTVTIFAVTSCSTDFTPRFIVPLADKQVASVTLNRTVSAKVLPARCQDSITADYQGPGATSDRVEGQALRYEAQGSAAVSHAILTFLAAEPAFTRMAFVEVLAAGPQAYERYISAVRVIAALLDEGRTQTPNGAQLPARLSSALISGAALAIREQVWAGRTEELQRLEPDLLYTTLGPFLGQHKALRTARSTAQHQTAG